MVDSYTLWEKPLQMELLKPIFHVWVQVKMCYILYTIKKKKMEIDFVNEKCLWISPTYQSVSVTQDVFRRFFFLVWYSISKLSNSYVTLLFQEIASKIVKEQGECQQFLHQLAMSDPIGYLFVDVNVRNKIKVFVYLMNFHLFPWNKIMKECI